MMKAGSSHKVGENFVQSCFLELVIRIKIINFKMGLVLIYCLNNQIARHNPISLSFITSQQDSLIFHQIVNQLSYDNYLFPDPN
jgi:hypothetical protein